MEVPKTNFNEPIGIKKEKVDLLNKYIEQDNEMKNYVHVLFDTNQNLLCGVYNNENDVRRIIDNLNREDINILLTSLKTNILNDIDKNINISDLIYLEQQLKNFNSVKDYMNNNLINYISSYNIGRRNKCNYLYYSMKLNEFNKIYLCFSKPIDRTL
jgi:hypothetical protein